MIPLSLKLFNLPFLKRIDSYLLLNYPWLWTLRICYIVFYGLFVASVAALSSLLFFGKPYNLIYFWPAMGVLGAVQLLLLVYWFYTQAIAGLVFQTNATVPRASFSVGEGASYLLCTIIVAAPMIVFVVLTRVSVQDHIINKLGVSARLTSLFHPGLYASSGFLWDEVSATDQFATVCASTRDLTFEGREPEFVNLIDAFSNGRLRPTVTYVPGSFNNWHCFRVERELQEPIQRAIASSDVYFTFRPLNFVVVFLLLVVFLIYFSLARYAAWINLLIGVIYIVGFVSLLAFINTGLVGTAAGLSERSTLFLSSTLALAFCIYHAQRARHLHLYSTFVIVNIITLPVFILIWSLINLFFIGDLIGLNFVRGSRFLLFEFTPVAHLTFPLAPMFFWLLFYLPIKRWLIKGSKLPRNW